MSAFFSDDAVRVDLLRQRAFNMRWAQQPADVIPLTSADPDFPVAPVIQERLVRYVKDGVLSYTPPEGLLQFREATAEWMRVTRKLQCTADDIFATDSAAAAIAVVARASLSSGDEALIPDPVDFLFQHAIERVGARPVRIGLTPSTTAGEFIAAMEAALTTRTRMLWLCNPNNPLGVVYSREWLRTVAEWAMRHDLRILSDEVWSDIVYPPHEHVCLPAISPEIARNTVVVYGFSKNFALAGLRVGCVVCTDPEWRKHIVAASDAPSTVFGVSVLSQIAVIAAVQEARPWLQEFLLHLREQRDYVAGRIAKWPGVTVFAPQGTYVIFPKLRKLSSDARLADAFVEELCQKLREEARVAVVPGVARWFGPGATGHLRLSFATSRRILTEALDRLDPVVKLLLDKDQP